MGIPFGDGYMIFANPNPFAKNHVVIASSKELPQIINTKSQLQLAFDFLDQVKNEDYSIGFGTVGVSSIRHFHFQGIDGGSLPIMQAEKKEAKEVNGIKRGFVENYPANVIYLEGNDKDELIEQTFEILKIFNMNEEGKPEPGIPYNLISKRNEQGKYVVYIFPREKGASSQMPNNAFGFLEMGGEVVSYVETKKEGKDVGAYNAGTKDKPDWEPITAELITESLREVSFDNIELLNTIIQNGGVGEGPSDGLRRGRSNSPLPDGSPIELGHLLKEGTVVSASNVDGGINIRNIDMARKHGSAKIQFNDQAVRDVLKNGFNGFTPVIINMTPLGSPLMIMGASQPEAQVVHT